LRKRRPAKAPHKNRPGKTGKPKGTPASDFSIGGKAEVEKNTGGIRGPEERVSATAGQSPHGHKCLFSNNRPIAGRSQAKSLTAQIRKGKKRSLWVSQGGKRGAHPFK